MCVHHYRNDDPSVPIKFRLETNVIISDSRFSGIIGGHLVPVGTTDHTKWSFMSQHKNKSSLLYI